MGSVAQTALPISRPPPRQRAFSAVRRELPFESTKQPQRARVEFSSALTFAQRLDPRAVLLASSDGQSGELVRDRGREDHLAERLDPLGARWTQQPSRRSRGVRSPTARRPGQRATRQVAPNEPQRVRGEDVEQRSKIRRAAINRHSGEVSGLATSLTSAHGTQRGRHAEQVRRSGGGEVELASSFEREASSQDRSRLGRAALIVGILAGIAAIVGVLLQLFPPDNNVGIYQDRVAATCDQVHSILIKDRTGEILVPGPPAGGFRVRKNAVLRVLDDNVAQARIAFDSLDRLDVPGSLAARHQNAVAARQAWYDVANRYRAAVEKQLPAVAPLTALQEVEASVGGGGAANAGLNSAMTDLAGRTCQVTA
jgi:hypothetical protein